MRFRRTLALLAALGVLPVAAAAQDLDTVEVRTVPVAPGLHMLVGVGGNLAVASGDDGTFIVDDQFAPLSAKLLAAIRALTPRPVRFVLNTHWHGDHTGGNENMGRGGALVVAHENVRRRMSADQFIAAFGDTVRAAPASALPVVTFTDTVTFYLNRDTLRVAHVRSAHTDGDAIVWFLASNAVHMGDVFFNGMYPFVDVSTGGTVAGTIAAVDRVLALANDSTRIVPGHGPLADPRALRAYRDMLATLHARVEALVAAGRTEREVVAARPTQDHDGVWGNGFLKGEAFAAILYQSVVRERDGGEHGRGGRH